MDKRYYVDISWLRSGIAAFLFGLVIYLLLFFYIYMNFEMNGKVVAVFPTALYADMTLLLIGALLIVSAFKEKKEGENTLKALQDLEVAKRQGLISDEEYEEKKKEILSRL